jgi:hypothetical protein
MSPGFRILSAVLALVCLAILIAALTLTPDPSGMGTHRALGLQPCGWLQRTNLPCPSCGMTTSFAYFARGNLSASLWTQPMGTVLAFLAGVAVWVGLYIAVTGRPLHHLLRILPGRVILFTFLTLGTVAWAWKIFAHLNGWDGWH